MENNHISFLTADNVKIEGKITHRASHGLSVEITSPYKNIKNGVHMAWFSTNRITNDNVQGYAESLLKSIYDICQFTMENKDFLAENMDYENEDFWKLYPEVISYDMRKGLTQLIDMPSM